jgi:nitroreductase
MEFFEVVNKRRTIRDFENEVISKEIIEKIISAGLKAPTNDHMRDWQFVVITDKEVTVKLLECIPKGISDADMERHFCDEYMIS